MRKAALWQVTYERQEGLQILRMFVSTVKEGLAQEVDVADAEAGLLVERGVRPARVGRDRVHVPGVVLGVRHVGHLSRRRLDPYGLLALFSGMLISRKALKTLEYP